MLGLTLRRFASKISGGVTKNKKDSRSKRLGVKRFGYEYVHNNEILVRQRGFKWKPGYNVNVGKDHTIHSACDGYVFFEWEPVLKKTVVSVVPAERAERPKL
jgi:large subunit ribosomal protein L27